MMESDRKAEINGYTERIRHKYSERFYNNASKVIKFLRMPKWFFNEIVVEGAENVRKVQDKQLFYVPNHLSMADFLVEGYTFWKENLPRARWIAGENLFKFPFKTLWKKCGAIALDRKGKRRYMGVFIKEIRSYLTEGENLLVFAEGGRNYEGVATKNFQTGLFGILTKPPINTRDIYIVPVKHKYEHRVEEGVLGKVEKNRKKRDELFEERDSLRREGENLRARITDWRGEIKDRKYFWWDVYAFIRRPFSREKGNAYIYFGEPISLKGVLGDIERQKKEILAGIVQKEVAELGEEQKLD